MEKMRFAATICFVAIVLASSAAYAQEQEQEQEQEQNPYVFEDRHFTTGLQTQYGRLRILQNFAERSNLLQGIANYRVVVLEIQPQTFVAPSHLDADSLVYVQQGRGTVSMANNDDRGSVNVKQGDIIWIDAGTPTYLINRDKFQNLVLVKLLRTVATPGRVKAYFPAGGANPVSFLSVFSDEYLEAALNTGKEKMQRVLKQQKLGAILKATEQQITAISREGGGFWPFGGPEREVINIFDQRPTHSNQHGKFYEVDANKYRPLISKNLAISFANVSRGSMIVPHFNSEATKVIVVDDGEGILEMSCPQQQQQQQPPQQPPQHQYQKVSVVLKRGKFVVVPAGIPFFAAASKTQNLQLLCFEINSENNKRYLLAGKSNVVIQFAKEAKELGFGASEGEVNNVFGSQDDDFLVGGPHRQQKKVYADA